MHRLADSIKVVKKRVNVYYLPAGKDKTPAPAILLTRLKTSVGIVAVPPPVPASPPRGISAAASAMGNLPTFGFLLSKLLGDGRPKADTDDDIKNTTQRESLAKDTMVLSAVSVAYFRTFLLPCCLVWLELFDIDGRHPPLSRGLY
jgi:hypothetical protein